MSKFELAANVLVRKNSSLQIIRPFDVLLSDFFAKVRARQFVKEFSFKFTVFKMCIYVMF